MLDLESEVQWFNTHITEFFSFHEIKPLMPILALLPFLCISKKLYCTKTLADLDGPMYHV